MFCVQCSAKIPDNSKYCLKCGVLIELLGGQDEEVEIENLKKQFRNDMFQIYREADKIGYRPSYFLRMISEQRDIVDIARQLIAKETSGFEKLASLCRTDLSVEHFVMMPKYARLFNDSDMKVCKERLQAYKF